MEEKLVVFKLGGATRGVNVAQVQSIIPQQAIVAVPGTPPFIEGVVNLRGLILLDPACIFSQDEQQALAVAQGE